MRYQYHVMCAYVRENFGSSENVNKVNKTEIEEQANVGSYLVNIGII